MEMVGFDCHERRLYVPDSFEGVRDERRERERERGGKRDEMVHAMEMGRGRDEVY